MAEDLESFRKQAGDLLNDIDEDQWAHDFWLTRNGHGAGFWGRGHPQGIGERLTELCKTFGEQYLIIGDDEMLHAQ